MPAPTFEYTSNPLLIAPTTVSWKAVTVGAGVWVDSAWYELIASTPGTGIAVTGAIVAARASSVVDVPQAYEVELGVGAMGAEVPFGVVAGMGQISGYGPHRTFRPLGVPYPLANGLRVSARLRKSTYFAGQEGTWGIGLGYYALPLVGQLSTTTQQQATVPPASFGALFDVNSLPLWTWGSWVTLSSGLGSDIAVTGIQFYGETTCVFEMEIGYGASPTVLTRIRNRVSGGTFGRGGPMNIDLSPPLIGIPAGVPIVARFRVDFTTIFGSNYFAKLTYLPLPL